MSYRNPLIQSLGPLHPACIRSMLIVATLLAAAGPTLPAQMVVPIGARTSSDQRLPSTSLLPESSDPGRDPNYLNRVVPAVLVGAASAAALGVAAYAAADCSGESCYGALIGLAFPAALFGGILGSAAGAAAPRGRGLCTGPQRFGMAVGGAFLGALAATGISLAAQNPVGIAAFLTVPIGSTMFMRRC